MPQSPSCIPTVDDLRKAIKDRDLDALKRHVELGADLYYPPFEPRPKPRRPDASYGTALMKASESLGESDPPSMEPIFNFILEGASNDYINCITQKGWSALLSAVWSGNLSRVQSLLSLGVNPTLDYELSKGHKHSNSLLKIALERDNVEITLLIIDALHCRSTQSSSYRSASHLTGFRQNNLSIALMAGNTRVLQRLMDLHDNPWISDYPGTVMERAILQSHRSSKDLEIALLMTEYCDQEQQAFRFLGHKQQESSVRLHTSESDLTSETLPEEHKESEPVFDGQSVNVDNLSVISPPASAPSSSHSPTALARTGSSKNDQISPRRNLFRAIGTLLNRFSTAPTANWAEQGLMQLLTKKYEKRSHTGDQDQDFPDSSNSSSQRVLPFSQTFGFVTLYYSPTSHCHEDDSREMVFTPAPSFGHPHTQKPGGIRCLPLRARMTDPSSRSESNVNAAALQGLTPTPHRSLEPLSPELMPLASEALSEQSDSFAWPEQPLFLSLIQKISAFRRLDMPGILARAKYKRPFTSNKTTLLHLAASHKGPHEGLFVLKHLLAKSFYRSHLEDRDSEGNTPFMEACRRGVMPHVDYLLEQGAQPFIHNNQKKNALMLAATVGSYAIVKKLHALGLSLNAKDTNGRTALHYALPTGDLRLIAYLLAHGIDHTARDDHGQTALLFTLTSISRNSRSYFGIAELALLRHYHVPVTDTMPDGTTAFMLYAASQYASVMALDLWKHFLGGDLKVQSQDGTTPLMLAIRGHGDLGPSRYSTQDQQPNLPLLKTIDWMLSEGADPLAKSNLGRTALYDAIASNSSIVVQALLERGLDQTLLEADIHGLTPLMWSVQTLKENSFMLGQNIMNIMALLLKYGSRMDVPSSPRTTPHTTKLILQRQSKHALAWHYLMQDHSMFSWKKDIHSLLELYRFETPFFPRWRNRHQGSPHSIQSLFLESIKKLDSPFVRLSSADSERPEVQLIVDLMTAVKERDALKDALDDTRSNRPSADSKTPASMDAMDSLVTPTRSSFHLSPPETPQRRTHRL